MSVPRRLIPGRTTNRARILALATVGVLLASVSVSLALLNDGHGQRGHAAPRLIGQTNPRAQVNFALVLKLPGETRLRSFLARLFDPRSRAYHHFIDAKEFGRRFGVSAGALHSAIRVLQDSGVRILAQYPQRTSLDARAPVGVIERLFKTRLLDYEAPGGRRFHEPSALPAIPSSLGSVVAGVAGLSGRYVPAPSDIPAGGLRPSSVAPAYDLAPLYSRGIQGQGEKIGIFATSIFSQSDFNSFNQQFGLPQITPQEANPADIGPATDSSQGNQEEAALDLDVVHEVAPGATIIRYTGPYGGSFGTQNLGDVFNKAAADGQVSILSVSYGWCELHMPTADIQLAERGLEAAQARGISVFVATGDQGAYMCEHEDPTDHRLTIAFPASSPAVTAVGGTALAVAPTGQYAGENTWEDAMSRGGGGGGVSTMFSRPSWQNAIGVDNQFSTGRREIPDVAAAADPATGWAVFTGGQLTSVGGTSAATPFWSAFMALIDQYAKQQGLKNLGGDVAPMLYAIASTPQPAPPFHDITVGTNRYYPATVGWDFATGLGSPDVWNLAQDIVRYLKAHPPR